MKKRPTDTPETTNHHHYDNTLHAIQCIIEDEGLTGLYAGMMGQLIGVASQNFAYFYWYSVVRTLYLSRAKLHTAPSTAVELSLGAVAGALGQLFTIPVAVVTTRQQTQPKGDKKGMLATAQEVVESEDGWTGLWRGLKASLVLVVNPSITYGAYQKLREVLYPGKLNLRPHEAFRKSSRLLCNLVKTLTVNVAVLGAMSKALATLATQPLIVAKVGLQSRPPPARNGKPFKSFGEVMRFIVQHEGALGLFKGLTPQLVKGLLVQGFLMMTKERVELLFVLLFRYVRQVRQEQLAKVANMAAEQAKKVAPAMLK